MTVEERNSLSNRRRIKLFLEATIREVCDNMSDGEITVENANAFMLVCKGNNRS